MDNLSPDSISQISHKLRTPLTVIISTVNNLLDGAYGKLTDDQRIWLKKLSSHTETLENIAMDILKLLKSKTGILDADSVGHGEGRNGLRQSKTAGSALRLPRRYAPRNDTPTILIVDDEPDILDTIQEGMHMKGYKTITADNGADAVKYALKNKPDLILMDVLLKARNGVEVCAEIKSKISAFTPVLMVTGQNDLNVKFSDKENAPDDFLMKPFHMEELYSRVHSMLRIKNLSDELAEYKHKDAA